MPERGTSALAVPSFASRHLRRPTPVLRASPFVPAMPDCCVIVGVRTCLGRVYSPHIEFFDPVGIEAETSDLYGRRRRCAERARANSPTPRSLRSPAPSFASRGTWHRPTASSGSRPSSAARPTCWRRWSATRPAIRARHCPAPVAARRDRNPCRDRRNSSYSSYMTVRPARSASMPLRRPRFSISNRVRLRRIAAPSDRPRPLPHKA